jgi:hypothetical protein
MTLHCTICGKYWASREPFAVPFIEEQSIVEGLFQGCFSKVYDQTQIRMDKILYTLDIENEPALTTQHKIGGYNGSKQPINQQAQ